ncbi:trypsin-like peptidase domain-containing protein [Streptomyces sp. LHD-70]|uniref:S1C family serine protease n=1 Tax=Streptomyces sp. LHD-70 TaxID=3072140 RepID=UPI00280EC6F8|nr:trypsin-like peptidase domain-containing protein [Streptomyces sp. LHD-70]MDQ8702292.1 trypsin-like peptidase domain-containing protein [Streptomyces sp. LHD-70]
MDEGKPTGPKAKWWSRPAARASDDRERASGGEISEDRGAQGEDVAAADSPAAEGSTAAAEPTVEQSPEPPTEPEASAAALPKARSGVTIAKGPSARREGAQDPAAAEQAAEPAAARPKPLHDPDPYGTPPYGEPGPWAPAPPVQRPVPTPAQGTAVQPAQGTPARGTAVQPTHGTPAQGTPTQGTPAQGTPTHGTPAQGTSVPSYAVPPTQTPAAPGPAAPPTAPPAAPASATPANGTPHPAAAPHQSAQHSPAGPPSQATPPHGTQPQPQPQPQAAGHWQQYDPWRAPQAQRPLLMADGPAPAKGPRRGRLFVAALVLALVAGGVGGGVGAYLERHGGISTVELPQADAGSQERAPESVAGIAASALPSVVTLHVSGDSAQGTGTGFVLDDKGHILTNNHVVEPAGDGGEVSVTFSGGEVAKGRVVGRDSGYDLAVVEVSGVSGLKPLPLGNSDNVQVGDPVVAIGAPFDLSNTVTSGIISAKERPITAGGEEGDGSDVSYVDALQTDAPINPGNSGGPLVDHKARVIGINSAIRSAGNGSELEGGQSGSIGLGFAIPINQAKRVAEELINTGKATHPVIEVTLDTRYTGDGARVAKQGGDGGPAVSPGGPGDKAGIEPGDVITEVDGQRVHSGEELIVKIRAHRPGDRLELTLERGGAERTLSLELGAAGG